MKLPSFLNNNLILKITSLNSLVVGARLIISLLVQNLLAYYTGQAGIAKVGQIRNISNILMSVSSLGVFNGVVKYVSEYKNNQQGLQKLFSTVFVLSTIATLTLSLVMYFSANMLSQWLFFTEAYAIVFKVLAVATPFIAMNRIFNGVISGISAYKIHAKIEIIWYTLASLLLLVSLYYYNIGGVLLAIAVTPIVQFFVLIFIFGNTLREYIIFKKLSFKTPLLKALLGFTLMSFVGTVFLNFIEIELRTLISDRISENEAGVWTAMSSISKIYMQFLVLIFPIYILPNYAKISSLALFKKQVKEIYTTLLPLVFVGMLAVYLCKNQIIEIIYTDAFLSMTPLFKWQLLADFTRFLAVVLAYYFISKNAFGYFILTELISLVFYFIFAKVLISDYGTEGVVVANLLRYFCYLIMVFVAIFHYFKFRK
ncbi:MAG: O-antigen flippase [Flavobacteriaceae bacterium]|nr:O-antigen flippase [Flavobacteriaceae bacterium]